MAVVLQLNAAAVAAAAAIIIAIDHACHVAAGRPTSDEMLAFFNRTTATIDTIFYRNDISNQ